MSFFKAKYIDAFVKQCDSPINFTAIHTNEVMQILRTQCKRLDKMYLRNISKQLETNPSTFDCIAVLETDPRSPFFHTPVGIAVVEKGECGYYPEAWSLHVICSSAKKGRFMIGLYLYIVAVDDSLRSKVGLLELANGFHNMAALCLYETFGFKYDPTLYFFKDRKSSSRPANSTTSTTLKVAVPCSSSSKKRVPTTRFGREDVLCSSPRRRSARFLSSSFSTTTEASELLSKKRKRGEPTTTSGSFAEEQSPSPIVASSLSLSTKASRRSNVSSSADSSFGVRSNVGHINRGFDDFRNMPMIVNVAQNKYVTKLFQVLNDKTKRFSIISRNFGCAVENEAVQTYIASLYTCLRFHELGFLSRKFEDMTKYRELFRLFQNRPELMQKELNRIRSFKKQSKSLKDLEPPAELSEDTKRRFQKILDWLRIFFPKSK